MDISDQNSLPSSLAPVKDPTLIQLNEVHNLTPYFYDKF
jgi:hypothetical protein